MCEYSCLLDYYSAQEFASYSTMLAKQVWGDRNAAEVYLENYWMSSEEYQTRWQTIREAVFANECDGYPDVIVREGYQMIPLVGGKLFLETDFLQLQKCMLAAGNKTFAIIEHGFCGTMKDVHFRMRYPVNITWAELTSGNYVSSAMLELLHKDYFVVGDSTSLGKYAANQDDSIDLLVFTPELAPVFREAFSPQEGWKYVFESLAPAYDMFKPR